MASDSTSFNDYVELARTINQYSADSLPAFIKPCIINSPVFIHDDILEEPIISAIYSNLYNMYTGYILTALHLNSAISSTRTVRDILEPVSTNTNVAMKSYEEITDIVNNFAGISTEASQFVEQRAKVVFPTGRIIETTIAGDDPKVSVTVNLFVQLSPRVVPGSVLSEFVSLKASLSTKRRWLQWKADEISFWKDFVFQIDKLSKLKKALKEDKSGSLGEMLRGHHKSVFNRILKFTTILKSNNIANKIFIADSKKFDKYCNSVGLRIKRYADRQKLFESLFGMFIVLVDPMYNLVTIYVNSFDNPIQLTYNQCKDNATSDKVSLTDMMNVLSQNKMPSF